MPIRFLGEVFLLLCSEKAAIQHRRFLAHSLAKPSIRTDAYMHT